MIKYEALQQNPGRCLSTIAVHPKPLMLRAVTPPHEPLHNTGGTLNPKRSCARLWHGLARSKAKIGESQKTSQ